MNLSYYVLRSDKSAKSFTFYSDGPKGRIQKIITYHLYQRNPTIYSLALGDINPETKEVDYSTVSDNSDRDKILMTVAETVNRFCSRHPESFVLAQGNSAAKNRLYRFMISNHLLEIQSRFEVFGVLCYDVEPFRSTQNYDGFLVKIRRIYLA